MAYDNKLILTLTRNTLTGRDSRERETNVLRYAYTELPTLNIDVHPWKISSGPFWFQTRGMMLQGAKDRYGYV